MNHEYGRVLTSEISHAHIKDYKYTNAPGRESLLIYPRPRFIFESVIGSGAKAKDQWHELLPHFKDAINLKVSGHLLRTGSIAGEFASFLGLSEAHVDRIKLKGILHDLGKAQKIKVNGTEVYTFAHILNSSETLAPQERDLMDMHSEIGAEMLESAGMPDDIAHTVRHHHNTREQDRDTKIISIVDIYDATLGKNCFRPYRHGELMQRRRIFCEEGDRLFGDMPIYRQFRHWEALRTAAYKLH